LWQWAGPREISKLLGAPFGLDMTTDDVNNFIQEKIDKKLLNWTSTRLNIVGRKVIVNGVFLSTCLYFLKLWGGMKQGVSKMTSKIRNFYWLGMMERSRVGIAWWIYCLCREDNGLNFLDLGEALSTL
jgi:hypothetical protein